MILGLVTLGLVVLIIIRKIFIIVTIDGFSMAPELFPKDQLIVCRYWPCNLIYRGQIVLVRFPASDKHRIISGTSDAKYIKKVVGLPGDTMTLLTGVTHAAKHRAYMHDISSEKLQHYQTSSFEIPPSHFFVMGNHPLSNDSIGFGPLRLDALEGVVVFSLRRRQADISIFH